MQNLAFQFDVAEKQGVIRSAVTEQPINMIDADDIGAVVAELLVSRDKLDCEAATLTGSKAYTYDDIARILTHLLGQKIDFERQDYRELETALKNAREPDWHIQLLLQFNRAFNEGLGNVETKVVQEILDRKPTTLEDCLSRALQGSREFTDSSPIPS
jgi:NAD(P)H dehydrogenase (quinone)